jgi:hypothetical protein
MRIGHRKVHRENGPMTQDFLADLIESGQID